MEGWTVFFARKQMHVRNGHLCVSATFSPFMGSVSKSEMGVRRAKAAFSSG